MLGDTRYAIPGERGLCIYQVSLDPQNLMMLTYETVIPGAGWKRHPNGGGWVSGTASVSPDAYVGPNAVVGGNAIVDGKSQLLDYAIVKDEAHVGPRASIEGHATVSQWGRVFGETVVRDNAEVYGEAWVYGKSIVSRSGRVCGSATVRNSTVEGIVYGDATVEGSAMVDANTELYQGLWTQKTLYRRLAKPLAFPRGGLETLKEKVRAAEVRDEPPKTMLDTVRDSALATLAERVLGGLGMALTEAGQEMLVARYVEQRLAEP